MRRDMSVRQNAAAGSRFRADSAGSIAPEQLMTVPERVAQFLTQRRPAAFCDHCIKEALGLERHQQAQQATSALGAGPGYTRAEGRCSVCGEIRLAIAAN